MDLLLWWCSKPLPLPPPFYMSTLSWSPLPTLHLQGEIYYCLMIYYNWEHFFCKLWEFGKCTDKYTRYLWVMGLCKQCNSLEHYLMFLCPILLVYKTRLVMYCACFSRNMGEQNSLLELLSIVPDPEEACNIRTTVRNRKAECMVKCEDSGISLAAYYYFSNCSPCLCVR